MPIGGHTTRAARQHNRGTLEGRVVNGAKAMSRTESYAGKTFIVTDADTRLRNPDNLMEFERYKAVDPLPASEQVGNIKRIPKGTELKVDKIKIVPTGSSGSIVFAHVLSRDEQPTSAGPQHGIFPASSSTRRLVQRRRRRERAGLARMQRGRKANTNDN